MGTYDPTRPAPVPISAVIVGVEEHNLDVVYVQLRYQDTATDAPYTSAYFLSDGGGPAATSNLIPGTLGTGVREATVAIPNGYTRVALRYLWTGDLSDPTQNIWGPFSPYINVADTPGKSHGHGKPPKG